MRGAITYFIGVLANEEPSSNVLIPVRLPPIPPVNLGRKMLSSHGETTVLLPHTTIKDVVNRGLRRHEGCRTLRLRVFRCAMPPSIPSLSIKERVFTVDFTCGAIPS
jgi:hypothetical protein